MVERVIDAAAAEIGMDRVALRRLNMVKPEAMPYVSAMKQTYDSGDFNRVLDAAMAKMDWANFETRRAASAAKGKKRGIGMAYYLEATGGSPSERAEIRFADDGFVDVFVGTQSTGQGHETAYVMLTADQLGDRWRQDPHPSGATRIRSRPAAARAAHAACIPRARPSLSPLPV